MNTNQYEINQPLVVDKQNQDTAGLSAMHEKIKDWEAHNPNFEDFASDEYTNISGTSDFYMQNKMARLAYNRRIARHPDISAVLGHYRNEVLIQDNDENYISFDFTKHGDENIKDDDKQYFRDKASYIIDSVIDFNEIADDLFDEFMIDGELFFEKILDATKTRIIGLRKILPEFIDPYYKKGKIAMFIEKDHDYDEVGNIDINSEKVTLHAPSKIIYICSKIFEGNNKNIVYSFLERGKKSFNHVISMESSMVIRRLVRAPLMNVFNVNVNKMNYSDAQSYVKKMARTYKSKSMYDTNTGDFTNKDEFLTSIKNYWFPKFAGDEGTSLSTASFDTDLDQIGDVMYHKQRFWEAFEVPPEFYQDSGGDFDYNSTSKTQRKIDFNNRANKWGKKFKSIVVESFLTQLMLDDKPNSYRWYKNFNFKLTENQVYKLYKEIEVMKARGEYISTLKSNFDEPERISDYYVMKECMKLNDEQINQVYEYEIDSYKLSKNMEYKKQLIDMEIEKQYAEEFEKFGVDDGNEPDPTDPNDKGDSPFDTGGGDLKPKGGASAPTGMGSAGGGLGEFSGGEPSELGIDAPVAPELDTIEDNEPEPSERESAFDFDNRDATANDDME